MTVAAARANAAVPGDAYCEVRDLYALSDRGTVAVSDTSLSVRKGEILAIAGVSGNGQKQLVEVLAGQREAASGTVLIAGQRYHHTRAEMQRHGICILTEEPLHNDCVRSLSVMVNLALRRYDQPPLAWHGWLRRRVLRRFAEDLIARFRIRTSSALARIDSLSGGNVQRTVLARELSEHVRLLVLQNPCFGLDRPRRPRFAHRSRARAIAAWRCCSSAKTWTRCSSSRTGSS